MVVALDDVLYLAEVVLLAIAAILSIVNQQKRTRALTSVSLFLSLLVLAMMVAPYIIMLPSSQFWGIVAVEILALSFAFKLGSSK